MAISDRASSVSSSRKESITSSAFQPRAIAAGDILPPAEIAFKDQNVDLLSYFDNRRGVLFGLPGAFAPPPFEDSLKGFIECSQQLKTKVDFVGCIMVNDPFVLKAWAESRGVKPDAFHFICDSNCVLTRRLGLAEDLNAMGMGWRCRRFALVVHPGARVSWVGLDEAATAGNVLDNLEGALTSSLSSDELVTDLKATPSSSSVSTMNGLAKSVHLESKHDQENHSNHLPLFEVMPTPAPPTWTYDKQGADWDSLPNFCQSRLRQSPICFLENQAKPGDTVQDIFIRYNRVAPGYLVENDGQGLKIQTSDGHRMGSVLINNFAEEYDIVQFHFHSPAEHIFEDEEFRRGLELHILHENKDKTQFLVVGVTFEPQPTSGDHPFLSTFLECSKRLPLDSPGAVQISSEELSFTLEDVLFDTSLPRPQLVSRSRNSSISQSSEKDPQGTMEAPEFYCYEGSLTTPPCSENVLWYVKKTPEIASETQIAHFASILRPQNTEGNFRIPQNIDGLEYNHSSLFSVKGYCDVLAPSPRPM